MVKFFTLTALAAVTVVPASAATAKAKKDRDRQTICERAYGVRMAVIKRHGKRAPGRNICRFGVVSKYNKKWSKKATTKQRAVYLRALRALVRPPAPQLSGAGGPARAPAGTLSPRVGGGSHLAGIARCESGGNYRAVDPSGTYRGAYQFDRSTWASVGGSGDPAAASPAEQDKRAAMLYARRGAAPWPVCGR